MRAATDPQLAVAAARGANTDFRMALRQRPTSPFSWANFALSKLYLDEQDDELYQALVRAEELGPWEPEVQQAVIFVGLTVWNRLTPIQQAAVVRAMERGAQRDAAKIAEIAKTFNRVDLFCALSYPDFQGREVCKQLSKSGTKPNRPAASCGSCTSRDILQIAPTGAAVSCLVVVRDSCGFVERCLGRGRLRA